MCHTDSGNKGIFSNRVEYRVDIRGVGVEKDLLLLMKREREWSPVALHQTSLERLKLLSQSGVMSEVDFEHVAQYQSHLHNHRPCSALLSSRERFFDRGIPLAQINVDCLPTYPYRMDGKPTCLILRSFSRLVPW